MKFILFSFLLLLGFIFTSASPTGDDITNLTVKEINNCRLDYIIKHSKTEGNFYEESFKKFPNVQYKQVSCDKYIELKFDEYYENLSYFYKTNKQRVLSNNSNCIINNLKTKNITYPIEMLFIRSTYLPIYSQSKIKKMIQNIERSREMTVSSVINKCIENDFQELFFESLIDKKCQYEIVKQATTNCREKELIAKGFVAEGEKTFNLTESPHLKDITDDDCLEYLAINKIKTEGNLMERIEQNFEKLSGNTIRCIEKYIQKHQMFEVASRIIVLSSNESFTDKQKQSEKDMFMKKIKSLYAEIESGC